MSEDIMTAAEAAENAAMPRARVALAANAARDTAEAAPLPANVAKRPAAQKSPAEWAYERVVLYIQKFEEQLDADHEIPQALGGEEHVQPEGHPLAQQIDGRARLDLDPGRGHQLDQHHRRRRGLRAEGQHLARQHRG